MNNSFKATVRKQLIEASKSYSKLLDVKISIFSEHFEFSNQYTLRFYKTNFLHLTGVKTSLSAEEFFEKCFNKSIVEQDFDCDSTKETKGIVRQKMKHLVKIGDIFNKKLLFQEKFEKGKVACVIATTNGECTVGFVDAKYCVRPKTILDKNHLNKNKQIIEVVPSISKAK